MSRRPATSSPSIHAAARTRLDPCLGPIQLSRWPIRHACASASSLRSSVSREPGFQGLRDGVRALQRMFVEYVGVGPKWCIRRFRIAEATSRLAAGVAVDWAALAVELGYADQAHFSRDFTAILGEPPTKYAQRYPG